MEHACLSLITMCSSANGKQNYTINELLTLGLVPRLMAAWEGTGRKITGDFIARKHMALIALGCLIEYISSQTLNSEHRDIISKAEILAILESVDEILLSKIPNDLPAMFLQSFFYFLIDALRLFPKLITQLITSALSINGRPLFTLGESFLGIVVRNLELQIPDATIVYSPHFFNLSTRIAALSFVQALKVQNEELDIVNIIEPVISSIPFLKTSVEEYLEDWLTWTYKIKYILVTLHTGLAEDTSAAWKTLSEHVFDQLFMTDKTSGVISLIRLVGTMFPVSGNGSEQNPTAAETHQYRILKTIEEAICDIIDDLWDWGQVNTAFFPQWILKFSHTLITTGALSTLCADLISVYAEILHSGLEIVTKTPDNHMIINSASPQGLLNVLSLARITATNDSLLADPIRDICLWLITVRIFAAFSLNLANYRYFLKPNIGSTTRKCC